MQSDNPARLALELYCRGVRIDSSCRLEEHARGIQRTRAGLGSGLELCLPGPRKLHWVNVPVVEKFVERSPLMIVLREGTASEPDYRVIDTRDGSEHPVILPPTPEWYSSKTSRGIPMDQVGVLQGTYLGIYVGGIGAFWAGGGHDACGFCTSGENVGVEEELEKTVSDVVETARAAKNESGITFVHLNAGYAGPETVLALEPYVRALKEEVGILVGVQATPAPDLSLYDRLHALGVDHLSFCYEFHDPDVFRSLCPGKARAIGQDTYLRAIEYCAQLFGRGSCSGEIIAGVEPIATTVEAINWIASVGAFPTVCIFRPLKGATMEHVSPPDPGDMEMVFREVWNACRRHHVPVGMAPNIEVSIVMTPDDTADLVDDGGVADRVWRAALAAGRVVARPVFSSRMRPRSRPELPQR
jgi:hypothetical protein